MDTGESGPLCTCGHPESDHSDRYVCDLCRDEHFRCTAEECECYDYY